MSALSAVEPERGIVPREVFCVIEQAHRDVALAEDASEGRFTIAGVTVGPGPDPDWMGAALPPDDEWRIEWTKFYYGLDLAHAYRVTGEARFLHAWERLVAGFIAQVPIGEGVDSSDVAARRVQNWIYAWASFAAAPGFRGLRDDLEEELLSSVREHIAFIRHDLTPERNHRTLELYALLVVALALPALDEDGALLELATAELHKNLLTDVRSDGVHREHSTHYHLIALRSFVGARENARRFGIALPAGYDEHLSLACDFAMHCQRPDGAIPALSDSDNGRYGDVLALAGELLHRDDLRWVASAGADGSPPQRHQVSFPAGGYHVQRSGWGDRGRAYADERFLIFDCGPLGDGGHGHYDVLSVEIAAGGRPLVVDPGRYTYDEQAPNLRHWFKGTAAHNTVVVDGHDQAPYRRGKPRKGTAPSARLLERHTAPGLDVVRGKVTSTCYDAVHTRRIAFVADEYWVLEDLLAGERPHRYDLRFHLAADAWGRVAVECRDASYVVRAPGVALVVAADRAPVIEAGWVAPAYGVKLRAPVVSVVAAGAATTFTTLVVPLDDGAPAPEMTVRNDGDATAVEIAGERHRDTVLWSRGPGTIEVEQLGRHARAGFMRQDGASASAVAAGVGSRPEWMTWSARDGRATGREGEL